MNSCYRTLPTLIGFLLLALPALRASAGGDCPIPQGLSAEVQSNNDVRFSWTAVPGAAGYRVEVENDNGNPNYFNIEVSASTASYTMAGLAANANFKFKVRAVCADDKSDWSAFFSFRTGGTGGGTGACDVPTGLRVEITAAGAAVVSWTAAAGANGYEVEVEDADGTAPFKVNVKVTTTTATIEGLTAGGNYKVKVKSECGGGTSSLYSDLVFFTATAGGTGGGGNGGGGTGACDVPTGLRVEITAAGAAVVSWTAAAGANGYEVEVEDADGTAPFKVNVKVTATTATIEGLTAGGNYKVKVKSECGGGASSLYSDLVFFTATAGGTGGGGNGGGGTGACDVPTGLRVEITAAGAAVVSWTAAAGANGYEVEVEDADGTAPFKVNVKVTATTATIEGLTAGGNYKVKVKSECGGGASSLYSDLVFFTATAGGTGGGGNGGGGTGACDVPTGLRVEITAAGAAVVSWTAAAGANSYEVEVEDADGTAPFKVNVKVTATTATIEGLTAGGNYKVKVKSECGGGASSLYSDLVFFTATAGGTGGGGNGGGGTGACDVPTGLRVEITAAGAAVVSWTAAAGANGYEVEVEDADGTAPFKVNVKVTATTATIEGLTAGGNYKVKVKSECGGGASSLYSDLVFFTATAGGTGGGGNGGGGTGACDVPTGLRVEITAAGAAVVSWTAAAGANGYEVEVEDADGTAPFKVNVKVTATTATIEGLTAGGNYKVKVKSECGGGNSSLYSDLVFFTATAGGTGGGGNGGGGTGACTVPTGVQVSFTTSGTVQVSWTAVAGASGYEVEVEDADGTAPFKVNVKVTATTATIEGLTAGGNYKVKVKSECGGGNSSEYSGLLFFTTLGGSRPASTGACATPRGLTALVTGNSATLRWSKVDGAVVYEVEVEDGRNTPDFRLKITVADTTAIVRGLSRPGNYKFKVKSKCSDGSNGFYSLWARFSTESGADGTPTGCPAPTGIKVLSSTTTSATLIWTAATGVSTYEVEVEDGENTPPYLRKVKTNEPTITLSGLAPGGAYKVKVKSECAGGEKSIAGGAFFFSVAVPSIGLTPQPEAVALSVQAFPNPVDQLLTVVVPMGQPGAESMVRIIDLTGRVLWRQVVNAGEETTFTVPVSNWQAGLYLLQLQTSGQVNNQKLVVTHGN